MPRRVVIADDAREDLLSIYGYVAAHHSPERADRLLDRLQAACLSLAEQPLRGNMPIEMQLLGVQDYREIHIGTYRILYRVNEGQVVVYGVADGRRDMQGFLQRRLTR